ncbi:MAG: Type IV pilin [Parcubacteria group bacterium GW2011_GWA2_44_12]|nr:MAG: Type IV pilin [Parcubacteria group bacterium GW2011_GWA2_44_12]
MAFELSTKLQDQKSEGAVSSNVSLETDRIQKAQARLKAKRENTKDPRTLTGVDAFLVKLQKVNITEKIFFTKNLALMVKSGMSLNEAIGSMVSTTNNKKFQAVLLDLKEGVEKGQALSDIMEQHSDVFSGIFASMVRAGEKAGKLEDVLNKLAVQMKKDNTIVSKVKGAMIYPIIVMSAMVVVGIVMMVVVVPRVTSVFAEGGATLPVPTRILLGVSNLFIKHGIVAGIGVIILCVIFVRLARTRRGTRVIHKFILIAPILGPIVKKVNLARFSRTLASLLTTDIPIVETLNIVSATLRNVYYKKILDETAENLTKGKSMASILELSPSLFPSIVTQMIKGGEQSGNLSEVLDGLADFYEEEVDIIMTNLPTIIEPILMLCLGVGVGFFAVAIMLPIFSISSGAISE